MRDDHQSWGVLQHTLLHMVQSLWIQSSKTLIQDKDSSVLQQRAGDVEPTALAMRKLPAGLADYLPQPGWHAVEEWSKLQSAAQRLGSPQICWLGWPATPHEQVEGQGPGKEVIVVELWRGHDPVPPARGPERWQIQTTQEKESRLRLP
jgi:hypothetical protein